MLGSDPECSSVCRFALMAEMMQRYFPFFFGTKLSTPIGAPSGLEEALPNPLIYHLVLNGNQFLRYVESTILADVVTGLQLDMVGWLELIADHSQFFPCP